MIRLKLIRQVSQRWVVAFTITAKTFSTSTTPSEPAVTRVLYFLSEEDTKYCLGLIGDKKFFCSTKCEVMKHASLKFNPETGLFIRGPRKQDQCFTSTFLPDEFLEPSSLELFLSEEKLWKNGMLFSLKYWLMQKKYQSQTGSQFNHYDREQKLFELQLKRQI